MKIILCILTLCSLAACTLPQTIVKTGAAQPSLIVKGAPAGSILYVDGLAMGSAEKFSGKPGVLAVLEGAHQVEIRAGTTLLFSDKVFIADGETHAISITPVVAQ